MKRRTSKLTAFLTLLASAFVALSLAAPALADEAPSDAYEYTIRVFPGNRGTLDEDPVVKTVAKGYSLRLSDIVTVKITDSKYVQTGFRRSGSDSLIGGSGEINNIQEDMDFVVAYGVESNTVPYTLRFVEYKTGKQLAEPETYYGLVGSKPVAAFKYIEGYRPLYLAITGTLSADEENTWTFEYVAEDTGETTAVDTSTTETTTIEVPGNVTTRVTEVPGETTTNYVEGPGTNNETVVTEPGSTTYVTSEVPGSTRTTVVPGGTTEIVTPGQTTETTAPTATTTNPAANEGAAAEPAAPAQTTEAPATREILDLDTPLAGPETTAQGTKDSKTPVSNGAFMMNPALLAGLGVGVAIAVALWWFFVRRYKKEDDEEA